MDSNKDRKYYEKKKSEFANKIVDYDEGVPSTWGDTLGYTLAPAYTEEEVLEYEKTNNVILPKEMRDYLINISRERLGEYPDIFSLRWASPHKHYFKGDNKIANGWCFCDDVDYTHDCESDLILDSFSEAELNAKGIHANYFVYHPYDGCTNEPYLCVKGKYYGYYASYKDGDYFSID